MIDISRESLLTFSEAAASLPGKPNVSTIHRWRLRGCRGVKLESTLIGGVRYTSQESLQRFCNRVTAAADGTLQSKARTSSQRERAILRAEAELEAAGI